MNKEKWKVRLIQLVDSDRAFWQVELRHALVESQTYANIQGARLGWTSFARTHDIENWEYKHEH